VLVHWHDRHTFRVLARRYRRPLRTVETILLPLRDELQAGRITLRTFWRRFADRARVPMPGDWRTLWSEALRRRARPIEPVFREVRKRARAGFRLALFSNTDRTHFAHFRARRWTAPFERYLLSYELGAVKPEPAAYRGVERALRVAPSEIFFTDDKSENVRAARRRGWYARRFRGVAPLRSDIDRFLARAATSASAAARGSRSASRTGR
jgi:HAD superfamily hydrolase (TIGR01509 family)